jgi:YD repeat-containing protein
MKFQGFRISMALAAIAAAVPASAQLVSANHAPEPAAPYTAEFKITRVQTLANGATITHESKQIMARDSQGRTLNANTPLSAADDQPENTITVVHDPANNTQTTWDSRSRRVRVLKMAPRGAQGCWSTVTGNSTSEVGGTMSTTVSGAAGSGAGAGSSALNVRLPDNPAAGPASVPRSEPVRPVREDLGTDTFLGVEVKGTRVTRTVPVGQIGNDVPLVTVSEMWSAPSLGLTLRDITDSAQSGKSTREAVSLDLGEPDPSLFQPPEGYEVTTEEMHPVACRQTP